MENEFHFPDGSTAWFELSIQPIPEGVFVLSVDVTSRKQAEAELKKSEAKYRSLIEQATDGIFICNDAGIYVDVNQSACRLLQYNRDELLGKRLSDIIAPEDLHANPLQTSELTSDKELKTIRTLVRKDGSRLVAEISARKLDNGLLVGTVRDITQRRSEEEKILALNQELEKKIKARTLELEEKVMQLKASEMKIFESNEELIALNEELTASNEQFYQTNEELKSVNEKLADANKKIEEQSTRLLKLKEEQLNRVINSSDLAIWSFVLKGTGEHYISKSAERIFGDALSAFDHDPLFWTRYVIDEDRAEANNCYQTVLKRGRAECTYRVMTRAGKIKWVRQQLKLITEDQAQTSRMEGIATDITTLAEAEESVRNYRFNLDIIFTNTTEGILLLDNEGRVIMFNHSFKLLFEQFSNKDLHPGVTLYDMTLDARRDVVMANYHAAVGGRTLTSEATLTVSGTQKTFLTRYQPISNRGKITHVCITTIDITERKILEEERATAELLKAERELIEIRSRFISIASHEFRTPLSTITLSAAMIKKYKDRYTVEQIDSKLDNIIDLVKFMGELLDDVLIISKADAAKIETHFSILDLQLFCEKMINEVLGNQNSKREVKTNFGGSLGNVTTDEKLLRNILMNLLTNAIKFSPDTSPVELSVTAVPDAIFLSVRDYGVGIPADEIKRLFEPFFRASNAEHIKGTGLGLAIIKRAADLLGGKVEVKSEINAGTEFILTLPVASAEKSSR